MPQSLSRRLVPALGVTLAASLVLGALVVTATAGDQDPALPQWFGVAAPRVGDAWRYNASLGAGWPPGAGDAMQDEAASFALLQWVASAPARGSDGFLHTANLLSVRGLAFDAGVLRDAAEEGHYDGDVEAWSEHPYNAWYLAGTRQVLQSGIAFTSNDTYTNYGLAAGVGASVSRVNEVYRHADFDALPSCLATNALQGANVSLAVPLELFGACAEGDSFLQLPKGLLFKAEAVELVNGVQAVRFAAADHDNHYTVWFAPSIPYPVRLEVRLAVPAPAIGDGDTPEASTESEPCRCDGGGAHAESRGKTVAVTELTHLDATLDLVGLAPGSAELAAVDHPSDPAPAFALAARTPWGPDDSGVDHPFPLSAAYKAAKEDPTYADLRTFLVAHPNAYAASAAYFEGMRGMAQRERTWRITVADADEQIGFAVTQGTPDPLLPVAARGKAPMVTHVQSGWGADPAPDGLPASGVPAQFPTVASLVARWAAFDGSGLPAKMWAFHLECAVETDGPCPSAKLVIGAGEDRFDMSPMQAPVGVPGDPYGTETMAMVQRFVAFTQDGHALTLDAIDHRVDSTAVNSGPLPPAPASSGGYRLSSAAVSGLPPARWLPAPEQAAGVGFVAFLLGALYWIWPKLKAVAFLGLFSRVEKGDLLDHPARQRLAQLVEAEPGIHFHDLATRAGLANGTATHHLRKLEQGGHVTVRRSGRYACYFPGSRVEAREAAAAPVLKSDGARQVLATVRARPGLSNLELANATGLTPSTVNYHAQRLATAGLVEALRDGRSVRFHPLAPLRSEAANAAA